MELLKTKFIQEKMVNLFNLQSVEDINEEILNKIEDITLNYYNFKKEKIEYDFSDLKLMPNLKSITLNDFDLDANLANSINELSNLTTITFNNCNMNCECDINVAVENVFLSNTSFACIDFFKNKNSIKHIYMQDIKDYINLEKIIECIELEKMELLNSNIINTKFLKNFTKLNELNLSGSRADDLESIDSLTIKVIKDTKFYNIV